GHGGAPAAPGLPPDSDDTAAVLTALLRHGRGQSPQVLLDYRADGYFRCFQDERNPSITANAHVLEALALHLHRQPELGPRLAAPARMAAAWLVEQQLPDGSWQDKWHASPYYASWCCVLALSLHHPAAAGPAIDQATDRAVAWARATQRPDGSWGRWQGTVEETTYAVQLLARAAPNAAGAAIARGRGYLADPPPMAEQPPLWHAKDLYLPTAVVRAARLAALGPAIRFATAGAAAAPAYASAAAPAPPAAPSTASRAAAGGTG
ncbi:MAG: prenyltransferase, partial [Natronosporangium sp.]